MGRGAAATGEAPCILKLHEANGELPHLSTHGRAQDDVVGLIADAEAAAEAFGRTSAEEQTDILALMLTGGRD